MSGWSWFWAIFDVLRWSSYASWRRSYWERRRQQETYIPYSYKSRTLAGQRAEWERRHGKQGRRQGR